MIAPNKIGIQIIQLLVEFIVAKTLLPTRNLSNHPFTDYSMFYPYFSARLVIASLFLILVTGHVQADSAAVATAHPLATHAGMEILEQGGNAFDAAVAISAALAVVEPAGSGLGGGGFWLLHRAKDGFEVMIDGREKAPLAASKDMFVDINGNVDTHLSRNSALSAGIPGMPAAIVHLSENYGRLALKDSLKPAIRYAQQGFVTGFRHHRMLNLRKRILLKNPEFASIFLDNGKIPDERSILIQHDLSTTLNAIADKGRNGFYTGPIANKLVNGTQQAGGIWTLEDLANYQAIERQPIYGDYNGIRIISAAPPSSGGIVLVEALNILEGFKLGTLDEVTRKHLIVEAMRRAYRDRALFLGDPDFINIPTQQLLNKHYAAGLRASVRFDRALPSSLLADDFAAVQGGSDTTHFSIIDSEGNRVAATLSINFPFGSAIIPPGTGVVLNNEMDDFVSQTGALNGYGLTGSTANAIEPGKRMLSSMTPTFLQDNKRIAVLGTPGGSRIISMVLLATLNFANGNGPESWTWLPRFHHQYIPDEIQYEKGALTHTEITSLKKIGHKLTEINYLYGNMQSVFFNKAKHYFQAVSDPRGHGLALVR